MYRIGIALGFIVLLTACGGTQPSERTNEAQLIDLRKEQRPATISRGWINLRTLQIHDLQVQREAEDVYIEGRVTGWYFEPQGEVKGPMKSPDADAETVACWLRLRDRTIYRKDGGTRPAGASISGRYDAENELFYPDERRFQVVEASPVTTP